MSEKEYVGIIQFKSEGGTVSQFKIKSDSLHYLISRLRHSLIALPDSVLNPSRVVIQDATLGQEPIFATKLDAEVGSNLLFLNLLSDFVEQNIPDARQK